MAKRVLVGMSGGVDSAVAAALLVQQGYDVTGVMLRLWAQDGAEDAARVCDALGIPLTVLDCAEPFRREVVDSFTQAYLAGQTPNPCVTCNRRIKFGELLAAADQMGAEYIATGHYARIGQTETGRYTLHRAAADEKDQTYVLYALSQAQLSRTLFPLGTYEKAAVRQLAAGWKLPVAQKPDSQDICFIPDGDYLAFLKAHAGTTGKPGRFLDLSGNPIGRHDGIGRFTIGQRKGLGAAFGKPMFVVAIDAETGDVTLGEKGAEYAAGLTAGALNFLPFARLEAPLSCQCKTRYRSRPCACTVTPAGNDRVRVTFDAPERAVTPGQSVVFYQGDQVLGGGIILHAEA